MLGSQTCLVPLEAVSFLFLLVVAWAGLMPASVMLSPCQTIEFEYSSMNNADCRLLQFWFLQFLNRQASY